MSDNSVIAQTIIIYKKLIIIQMDLLNEKYSNFVTVIFYREILADIIIKTRKLKSKPAKLISLSFTIYLSWRVQNKIILR